MSTISLRLPTSLHLRVRSLSHKDHVSINQFIASAVAEKLSALDTEEYLNERARRASKSKYVKALSLVPDKAPQEGDQL